MQLQNCRQDVDRLKDDIWQNHHKINIVDLDFYDVNAFNRCKNGNYILTAIKDWASVHPSLKVIPVECEYSVPYGILHNPNPSNIVKRFLSAAKATQSKK